MATLESLRLQCLLPFEGFNGRRCKGLARFSWSRRRAATSLRAHFTHSQRAPKLLDSGVSERGRRKRATPCTHSCRTCSRGQKWAKPFRLKCTRMLQCCNHGRSCKRPSASRKRDDNTWREGTCLTCGVADGTAPACKLQAEHISTDPLLVPHGFYTTDEFYISSTTCLHMSAPLGALSKRPENSSRRTFPKPEPRLTPSGIKGVSMLNCDHALQGCKLQL